MAEADLSLLPVASLPRSLRFTLGAAFPSNRKEYVSGARIVNQSRLAAASYHRRRLFSGTALWLDLRGRLLSSEMADARFALGGEVFCAGQQARWSVLVTEILNRIRQSPPSIMTGGCRLAVASGITNEAAHKCPGGAHLSCAARWSILVLCLAGMSAVQQDNQHSELCSRRPQ